MAASILPEVHEGDAPPEIAAIYAGLRTAIGVPIVNLIWRHFATLPGVLPWAWETTRGAIGSATVADGSARMVALVREAPGAGLSAVGPALAALPAAERARVADVVRVYNRGNQVNLQVLTAVRRVHLDWRCPGRRRAARDDRRCGCCRAGCRLGAADAADGGLAGRRASRGDGARRVARPFGAGAELVPPPGAVAGHPVPAASGPGAALCRGADRGPARLAARRGGGERGGAAATPDAARSFPG